MQPVQSAFWMRPRLLLLQSASCVWNNSLDAPECILLSQIARFHVVLSHTLTSERGLLAHFDKSDLTAFDF
ncbi:MAG: hypothetical protein QNJ72_23835 [Pleurocapsa sp. MO_226.B13]|nr:hypothetical protein [Pleurocapsa sp. MO_226.B13]